MDEVSCNWLRLNRASQWVPVRRRSTTHCRQSRFWRLFGFTAISVDGGAIRDTIEIPAPR